MTRYAFLITLLASAGAARAGTSTTYKALEFARPAGSAPLLLGLRVPDGAGPFPVIVFLHSGAWISEPRCRSFARAEAPAETLTERATEIARMINGLLRYIDHANP